MTSPSNLAYPTPFELGNGNQTTTWAECIAFYERLAERFPGVLRWWQIGTSDTGLPMHAGLVTADGVFDRDTLRRQQRPVFFNNNGIHPGEPEGIDACMALVRDLCVEADRLSALGATVFLFIPVYNVDGCVNRQSTSRANQLGPESFGFRGNGRHLDLNRDFIKCDSLAAQTFNRFFTDWDPDVMVDTHTANGADYAYAMTLIPTQPDKLGGGLGDFLRERMLPAIYGDMQRRGWPTCPYVNLLGETPDDGIEDFLVHFDRCVEELVVTAPKAYLVPQAWREVIERLEWNDVALQRLDADRVFEAARVYRVLEVGTRASAYEGHPFHDRVLLSTHFETIQARAGDVLVPLDQSRARYAVETLEPEAHDSFFCWGVLRQRAGAQAGLDLGLRLRRHRTGNAGRRAGAAAGLRRMEGGASSAGVGPASGTLVSVYPRPAPCRAGMAALSGSRVALIGD